MENSRDWEPQIPEANLSFAASLFIKQSGPAWYYCRSKIDVLREEKQHLETFAHLT
jgi:hypothetical protein